MAYLLLKYLHIIGAAVLFGTGLGIAFFLYAGMRMTKGGVTAEGRAALALICRLVVMADAMFTAVAVLLQPITGIALVMVTGYNFAEFWVVAALGLYLFIGVCWLPVVVMQNEMSRIASRAVQEGAELPPQFHALYRRWFLLGWPAFGAMLVIFWLMIEKPDFLLW